MVSILDCLFAKFICPNLVLSGFLIMKMYPSYNPHATILKQNKQTRPNYVDCNCNLDILTAIYATQEEKKRYDCLNKFNEMAKWYIWASLSNILQHDQIRNMSLALDIMFSLKEMFDDQGCAVRLGKT